MPSENTAPLLSVNGLCKAFPMQVGRRKQPVNVVEDVSFSIDAGESVGLVGESGCGKTTVGRTIIGLYKPDGGSISIDGKQIGPDDADRVHETMQMVFQDPYTSLDPRKTIADILSEPLKIRKVEPRSEWRSMAAAAVERVGLKADCLDRYPYSLSGGQRQRIAIARALILQPRLVICDEAVSALDVSVQAQVLNMLFDLQAETGVAYLFISHDLAVVRHLCTRIVVMYLGRVVEVAETDELFSKPLHPYVEALLSAVPVPDPDIARAKQRIMLDGELPSLAALPEGCIFSTRCPHATDRCLTDRPELVDYGGGHMCACLRARELDLVGATEAAPGIDAGPVPVADAASATAAATSDQAAVARASLDGDADR